MTSIQALPRSFYDRPPIEVARELLGKRLLRRSREGLTGGTIVEVEAYLAANDSACHSHRGQTRRNEVMFGGPGYLYVYAIHSRYCLNAVTEPAGVASAVLIRAVEPDTGLTLMQDRRQRHKPLELTRGPGRLCEAMGVDGALNGWDLTRASRIWITSSQSFNPESICVASSTRIGVTSAEDLKLRFYVAGNRFVSGPRSHS